MDKKSTKKKGRKKQQTYFPGDPRYGVQEHLLRQDVGALADGEMLNTRILNCLIQCAAPPPAETSSNKILLGSLSTRSFMDACNALFEGEKSAFKENRVEKIRSQLEHVFDLDNDCVNRLIIPIVEAVYFFVLVVDFNQACPDFFVNVKYYDSLRRSTRGGGNSSPSSASDIVAEVNDFLCNFVLHKEEREHLQVTHYEVFEMLGYEECPPQNNGIDCGLFCVGVLLHLLDGKTVDRNTFSHHHITKLRFKLADHFMGARLNRHNEPTSNVIRDCFPKLRGTTIASEYGVEDVTPLHIPTDVCTSATATAITTTRSTTNRTGECDVKES